MNDKQKNWNMRRWTLALASLVALISGCAVSYRVTPIDAPPATVRYDHGAPTTSLEQRNGGVQVTPMQFDQDGRMVFGVAVFNKSDRPANFGTENIQTHSQDNKTLRIYTVDDLIREARNKAIAASVAIALLGVAAAAASQAAAHQTYHSTLYTPHGVYRYKASYYDGAQAAAGTAASIGGATAGIYAVHQSLDAAIAGIGESVLQTTTVDPGESIAGRVLVQRTRSGDSPQEVAMFVNWNDEMYPFRFQVARTDGRGPHSPAPVIAVATPEPAAQPEPAVSDAAPIRSPSSPEKRASPPPAVAAAAPAPIAALPRAPQKPQPPRVEPAAMPVPAITHHEETDDEYNARIWKEQNAFAH